MADNANSDVPAMRAPFFGGHVNVNVTEKSCGCEAARNADRARADEITRGIVAELEAAITHWEDLPYSNKGTRSQQLADLVKGAYWLRDRAKGAM